MSPGHEAYDAEVTVIAKGLLLLVQQGSEGQGFTFFTDSQVAMIRVADDAPGPGQELATIAASLAEQLVAWGNTIDVR